MKNFPPINLPKVAAHSVYAFRARSLKNWLDLINIEPTITLKSNSQCAVAARRFGLSAARKADDSR